MSVHEDETPTLRYPIGKFEKPEASSPLLIQEWVEVIEQFPKLVSNEIADITPEEQESRYRPEGWTIRQVVHHCADSHMNSFIRFKLALTEDAPIIKPYYEERWAEMPDVYAAPLAASMQILEGLHARWAILLRNMSESDINLTYTHPDLGRKVPLWEAMALYAWHCRHHLAHIKQAKGMPPLV
jgi:hypothetical protein